MVDCLAVITRGLEQFRIGLKLPTRHILIDDTISQRRCFADTSGDFNTADGDTLQSRSSER